VTDDAIITIYEPARAVDVVHRVPVLVVGGGPSGLAAAIAAARAGAEVSLLERFGCFGGNLTVVGVEGLAWYRHEATVEAGGIGREFEERAKAMGAATPDSQSLSYEIDSEGFKVVADRLVEEAGVRPLLHRAFAAPVMNGDAMAGVIVESKAGREAILADRVVDCTGDADVAHRAGAPTRKTPIEEMQAASVMFHLSGVDKQAFLSAIRADPATYADWSAGEWTVDTSGKEDGLFSPYLRKPFAQAIRDGVIPANLSTLAGTWGALHDTGELTYMNLVHLAGCDGTDPDTRKIDAVYNLTEQDVRGEARFGDSIGIYPEFIDGYGVLILPTTGRYLHIPYRALLPRGVRNLLVAGRAIGGDRIAHAATRNMACCAVTGQAAGIAAALSVRTGRSFHELDADLVQAELDRQGVRHQ